MNCWQIHRRLMLNWRRNMNSGVRVTQPL